MSYQLNLIGTGARAKKAVPLRAADPAVTKEGQFRVTEDYQD